MRLTDRDSGLRGAEAHERRVKKSPFSFAAVLALAVTLAVARDARADRTDAVKIPVKRDVAALAVFATGESDQVLVYLPGHCGDPLAGVHAFPAEAAKRGTLLVVQGDQPCPDGRRKWSADLVGIQRRIDAAIAAAATVRGQPLDAKSLTLLGYSQGALRAEQLVKRFPDRYPRVAIMASPRAPTIAHFPTAARTILAVGALDRQDLMKDGFDALSGAGVPALLLSFPDAGHGSYGPEGARVMDEAFAFLFAEAAPAPVP